AANESLTRDGALAHPAAAGAGQPLPLPSIVPGQSEAGMGVEAGLTSCTIQNLDPERMKKSLLTAVRVHRAVERRQLRASTAPQAFHLGRESRQLRQPYLEIRDDSRDWLHVDAEDVRTEARSLEEH